VDDKSDTDRLVLYSVSVTIYLSHHTITRPDPPEYPSIQSILASSELARHRHRRLPCFVRPPFQQRSSRPYTTSFPPKLFVALTYPSVEYHQRRRRTRKRTNCSNILSTPVLPHANIVAWRFRSPYPPVPITTELYVNPVPPTSFVFCRCCLQ
jgi:hypothetical protein